MIIFSGQSNQPLAKKIADCCGFPVGEVEIETFPNGEKRLRILSKVAKQEVVLLQSFSRPVDENIIEFLLLADALERAGAKRVTAVIPWFGYSLQDKVFRDGEPMAARVIADVVSHSFAERVILMDLHNSSIPGFFSVPTEYLRANKLFEQYVRDHFDLSKVVVISPDFGGIKQARVFADALGVELANIDKHRDLSTGKIKNMGISRDVKGKIAVVIDDVVNTGGTVVEGAKFLKENGASEVHFCISHGLFAGDGLKKMSHEAIDSVVITDSVHHDNLPKKIKVVSVAELIGESLKD